MTTHELAKILLEGPDIMVVCQDGADPSDWCDVIRVSEISGDLVLPNFGVNLPEKAIALHS